MNAIGTRLREQGSPLTAIGRGGSLHPAPYASGSWDRYASPRRESYLRW